MQRTSNSSATTTVPLLITTSPQINPNTRRMRRFGHTARSSSREDHQRALAAAIRQVPPNWKRPAGRPSHTWLRAIEADLALWTLASRLPGEKPLLEMNGDILCTQQWSTLCKDCKDNYSATSSERCERFLSLPPGRGTVCHQQSLLRQPCIHSVDLFTTSFPLS